MKPTPVLFRYLQQPPQEKEKVKEGGGRKEEGGGRRGVKAEGVDGEREWCMVV